jgi:hypothetical protein
MSADGVGVAIEMLSAQQLPIESVDQLESRKLIKLIRKLRWIGMEREAEQVTRALVGRFAISGAVAGLPDTD